MRSATRAGSTLGVEDDEVGPCPGTEVADVRAGQGVGTALLGALVDAARADDKVHSLLALIVSTNAASLKLHEKFGFENVGTLKEVCYKFDHWLSLTHLQLLV